MNVKIYGVFNDNIRKISFEGRLEIARKRHHNVPRDSEAKMMLGEVKIGDLVVDGMDKIPLPRPLYYVMKPA